MEIFASELLHRVFGFTVGIGFMSFSCHYLARAHMSLSPDPVEAVVAGFVPGFVLGFVPGFVRACTENLADRF